MIIKTGGRGWDCNQFLIKDPKSNAFDMVDAGHGMDWDAVMGEVSAVTDPKRVRTIYVTHEHLDHVNGLPYWKELGARIVASPSCAEKLAVGHDPTSAQFGMDIPTLEVDVASDGDCVQLGGFEAHVLETPGHCPGSACYFVEDEGILFSGDTAFAGGGIGRFDFPDSNHSQLVASLQRLALLDVKVCHCGHGPSTQDPQNLVRCVAHAQSA